MNKVKNGTDAKQKDLWPSGYFFNWQKAKDYIVKTTDSNSGSDFVIGFQYQLAKKKIEDNGPEISWPGF